VIHISSLQDIKKVGPNLKDIRLKLNKNWIPVWLKKPTYFRQSPARSRIPESCQMLGGFCTLLGSRTLYPVTLVLAPWRYVISSASTQLRFRLYSQDASTNRKGRSSSGRNLSPVGLRSLVRPCQE